MMRRPKVRRFSDGTPFSIDRCEAEIQRDTQLFPDRCRRARKLGYSLCAQHLAIHRQSEERELRFDAAS